MKIDAIEPSEVDVVDRKAVFEAIDQVNRRIADAVNRRELELHRPRGDVNRLRAEVQRLLVGRVRVAHPECEAARGRPVLIGEIIGEAFRLAINQKIDLSLAVKIHVLGAVVGDPGEAQGGKNPLQDGRIRGGEFNELESAKPERVLEQIALARLSGRGRDIHDVPSC